MSLTVGELIKELKKYPKDSFVGIGEFDNFDNEISCTVHHVSDFDPEKSFDSRFCKNVYVVLRG